MTMAILAEQARRCVGLLVYTRTNLMNPPYTDGALHKSEKLFVRIISCALKWE